MAINIMTAVWDRGPSSSSEMLVLLALADSADRDTGECFPSLRTIARRARMTERGARLVLLRLWDQRWLRWSAEVRLNGSSRANLYRINLAKLGLAVVEYPDFLGDERPPSGPVKREGRGNHVHPRGGTTFTLGGEPRSPSEGEPGSPLETRHKETRAVPPPAPQSAKAGASAPVQDEKQARDAAPGSLPVCSVDVPEDAENGLSPAFRAVLDLLTDGQRVDITNLRPVKVDGRWIEPGDTLHDGLRHALWDGLGPVRGRV